MSALLDSLQAAFEALPGATQPMSSHAASMRMAAMRGAVDAGLPTQRHERWKYTGLRALSARSFVLRAEAPLVHPAALADIPSPRIVFVNGHHEPALCDLSGLADGLSVDVRDSLPRAPSTGTGIGTGTISPGDTFTQLNAALATQGVQISVAPGVQLMVPVHLVFVSTPAQADIAMHLQHCVEVATGARLQLIEHHLALGAHRHLANHLLQIGVGAGATLVHARLQDEDDGATLVTRVQAALGDDARYQRVDLELGAALSRHEIDVQLTGARCAFTSGGALLAGGRRHVDLQLDVAHRGGDSRCQLLWRGLAADRGHVAFHGGIVIHAGADGSDASLSNKNLLLSASAEIDTQPVLEIHADEVKAAHGATVGRLDETALFYLRSRGIPLAQARALLTLAFCREALASTGDLALMEALSPRLEARLAQLDPEA